MNALRDWKELPKWIQELYHNDPLIQRTVKDWRMTNKETSVLFERLAIQLLSDRDYWKKSYEKTAKTISRITLGS